MATHSNKEIQSISADYFTNIDDLKKQIIQQCRLVGKSIILNYVSGYYLSISDTINSILSDLWVRIVDNTMCMVNYPHKNCIQKYIPVKNPDEAKCVILKTNLKEMLSKYSPGALSIDFNECDDKNNFSKFYIYTSMRKASESISITIYNEFLYPEKRQVFFLHTSNVSDLKAYFELDTKIPKDSFRILINDIELTDSIKIAMAQTETIQVKTDVDQQFFNLQIEQFPSIFVKK
ncbi:hypothetical protein TRFO_01842 [Tritrichomonas foetus]|uniref:Uncharacterized protein n=1 Tax=Tritrichomonas foetus TaxID=1144522 RepID=A0A1J4JI03_9EUKA|nr:hypothetical protein TRFO_01842 [Tritrichomonas foetus]|eukprot:OHS98794.1 hypothetical protein TRFO_01842 [Tritrichomonas foetus]